MLSTTTVVRSVATRPCDRFPALFIVVCTLAALLVAPALGNDASFSVRSPSGTLSPRTATGDLNCDAGPLTGNVCIVGRFNSPFAIPDQSFVSRSVSPTAQDLAELGLSDCKFHDVNLAIDATHSHLGDLQIQLEKDGFFAFVYEPPGSCNATSLASIFDNDAAAAPSTCPAPAVLRPVDPLSFPSGWDDVVGTFTLGVADLLAADVGQVQSWGVALDSTCTIDSAQVCVAGPNTLCLNDGRFRVEADWERPNGTMGSGTAIELTDDTGYFWFFDSQNVELVVKVLNACGPPFNRYWVFAAGLTNVEVSLTVTDTQTGEIVPYFNPLGTPFQPIQDTDAFATCP